MEQSARYILGHVSILDRHGQDAPKARLVISKPSIIIFLVGFEPIKMSRRVFSALYCPLSNPISMTNIKVTLLRTLWEDELWYRTIYDL